MPRKPGPMQALDKKWNMYVNEVDKSEFILALVKRGNNRAQSAAIRAFMFLYANDADVANKVDNIIDIYKVYNVDGSVSIM